MDVILTSVITSLITTSIAVLGKAGWGWVSARKALAAHPLTLARNPHNGFTIVNNSALPVLELSGHSYGPGPQEYQNLVSSGSLLPRKSVYIYTGLPDGANVFLSWRTVRGRRVSDTRFADVIKIQPGVDRYTPISLDAPPPEWGG